MTKRFLTISAVPALVMAAVLFGACDSVLLSPDGPNSGLTGDGYDPDTGLVVGIRRLYFDQSLLGARAGEAVGPRIELTRFPAHNTMPHNAVRWSSSDRSLVTVDEFGEGQITVVLDYLPTTGLHREATIRAEYIHDPSIFAEATMMVLPDWPANRLQLFDWGQASQINMSGAGTTAASIEQAEGLMRAQGFTLLEDGNWSLGNGIMLLTGTGDVNPDPGRQGDNDVQGVFPVDDEHGVIANGNPRLLGSLNHEGLSFPEPGAFPVARDGHIRTAGAGMRVLQAMGLQRPFEVTVRYRSNASDPRWVDLRFGDTSGIRVEGIVSPSNAASFERVLRFVWDYDEQGNPRDDFVPFMFVEAIGGVQIYDLEIRYLGP